MHRRLVLQCLVAAALPDAPRLRAQPLAGPVVGLVFTPGTRERMLGPSPASLPARAFVQALSDLGWVDGENIRIERIAADSSADAVADQFRSLRTLGAKVNVLAGARWIQDVALLAAPDIPIVTLFHEDPVSAGLVRSLSRPERQITGVMSATGPELDGKRIQFLRELVPTARKIAYLGPRNQFDQYRNTAPADITLVPAIVEDIDHYDTAFATVREERPDALLAAAGPINYRGFPVIVRYCAELRLPAVYAVREAVDGGGLLSYGPSIPEAFRQMARMTHRILNGEPAAEIPVEQPTKFDLVVNINVAKSLQLSLPPSLAAFASDIVEH